MRFGLNEEMMDQIYAIIHRYRYDFYMFGSRARGDYRKNSDIDIAVLGEVLDDDKDKIRSDFDALVIPYMLDILFVSELKNIKLIENIKTEGVKLS